jgi:hypothetical protein
MNARRAAAAPGPKISRFERPRAVRRSRSDVQHLLRGTVVPVSISYEPRPDGDADPGEVVWAWVPYEDDPERGKDRPVLVIGRDGCQLLALQLTSKDHDRDAAQEAGEGRFWMDVGTGEWDPRHRPSEVRLNRLLRLAPDAVRREGSRIDPQVFTGVIAAAREFHQLPD